MRGMEKATFERTWQAMRRRLDVDARELSRAVRAYPTPIARCDEQLPLLIAQRDAAVRRAAQAADIDAAADDDRARRIALFVETLAPGDDARLAVLRDGLRATAAGESAPC
jgi:hypothetical protein